MDPLADLPNAEDFEALLAREEVRRGRTNEVMAVAKIDLDDLRAVNREHGAQAGTEVLRIAVSTLRSTLRSVDEIARTGGDEFSALLHGTDSRSAAIWADRFQDELAAESFQHVAGPVTCAVGIADTSGDLTLIQAAAKAHRRMEVIQTMRKLRRRGPDAA
ncbi:MAG TPA: GGDEF domain-containing protein [Thermoleophilaceae bacterium]|jgi:diguanylate cyclase (GGDEF)-like protein